MKQRRHSEQEDAERVSHVAFAVVGKGSRLTTPHKLRIEARSRKRTGLLPVVRRTTQTDGRGRQLHAVVSQQAERLGDADAAGSTRAGPPGTSGYSRPPRWPLPPPPRSR